MSRKRILWSDAVRARIEEGEPHFLDRSSLSALQASTASGIVDAAVTHRPDLIVLPIEPQQTPLAEICRHLHNDPRTRGIPVVAIVPGSADSGALHSAGCRKVLSDDASPAELAEAITSLLGMRLRRHRRFGVVLPVSRGRFFHEFLGYSNSVSEGGMGFETIVRVRRDDHIPLRIYRNTEEKPIATLGRVCGIRANLDTGVGYAVGVEFVEMRATDRERLMELFPRDGSVIWGTGGESPGPPPGSIPPGPGH